MRKKNTLNQTRRSIILALAYLPMFSVFPKIGSANTTDKDEDIIVIDGWVMNKHDLLEHE